MPHTKDTPPQPPLPPEPSPEAPPNYRSLPGGYRLTPIADFERDILAGRIRKVEKLVRQEHPEPLPTPETPLDLAQLKTLHTPYLKAVFKGWNINQATIDTAKIEPTLTSPTGLDYAQKKADIDPTKFGEYTMNPDTAGINWETIPPEKIKSIDLGPTWVGKPLDQVAKHIIDTYSTTHHIPGLEYWQYLSEHQGKIPPHLNDGKWQFFFGSLLRDSDGIWSVPSAGLFAGEWERDANWLDDDWGAGYRVVLLER